MTVGQVESRCDHPFDDLNEKLYMLRMEEYCDEMANG